MPRVARHRYQDPLDVIWTRCAEQLGWTLRRTDDTYASWDGRGTLSVCTPDAYDADDSLAQLLLHEICHALVQGPSNQRRVDWGLDNLDDARSAVEEHACHRLQAALLDRWGLRHVLAVTTDWWPYWDALPADPLAPDGDPATGRARAAWPDAVRGRWSAPLRAALQATASIVRATAPFASPDHVFARAVPVAPVGTARATDPDATCGTCAWFGADGRCVAEAPEGRSGPVVLPHDVACYRHEPREPALDCQRCGACCREGYDLVPADGPLLDARPDLVAHDAHGPHLPRPDGRCVALSSADGVYACAVYALRPAGCRDLAPGSSACLVARQRVGLSRPGL